MKKLFTFSLSLILIIFFSLLVLLATSGVETNRFNTVISQKINQSNNKIKLDFKKIKFKLDINQIDLFLETKNPNIYYRDILLPAKSIKVYIDFMSIVKSVTRIEKINLVFDQIDIDQLKKISVTFKPSNLTSFLNNKINSGKLNTEIEVYLDDNNMLENFIARGDVSALDAQILEDVKLENTNFNFFADKTDILIKDLNSNYGQIFFKEGDLKLNLSEGITLESNFKTNLKYSNVKKKNKKIFSNQKYFENLKNIEAKLKNNLVIILDKTYKIKRFEYKNSGKILKADFDFKVPIQNYLSQKKISHFSIIESELKTNLNSKNNTINILGKYSFDKNNFKKFDLKNFFDREIFKVKLNADFEDYINLDFINYKKDKGKSANISFDLEKKRNTYKFKEIKINDQNNKVVLNGLKLRDKKFLDLEKIFVSTNLNGENNNEFSIFFDKKILINGKKFDASNLQKFLNRKSNQNFLSNISKEVEINFENLNLPLSENLKNFRLIGKIKNGKFLNISSKGDYGDNNFLDITLKNDNKTKKKYLEVYSDIAKPLLSEFSFFNGLSGGQLFYTSVFDETNSTSKLKLENFKVVNAPGMVKLLTLADLGGLADLAEGDGISFNVLEINMEKTKGKLTLNEILALGPSISVLMEGYQTPSVTSLRGTLVPAKTLNKIISRIPVIGNIVIPKEIGEGLFGISFKMKGPPNKIKTTINPIRTLTPRFIQKIVDKNNKIK